MLSRILVATDFSRCARGAYPAAAALARRHGATLHLAHAVIPLPPYYFEEVVADVSPASLQAQLGKDLEAEAGRPEFGGLKPDVHLIGEDVPYEALARFAGNEGMDLVVVATHGRTGFSHAVLGSFTEKLVRRSEVPVLVWREAPGSGDPSAPQRILAPVDWSEHSRAVLTPLRAFLGKKGTEVTFLHVMEPQALWFDPGQPPSDTVRQAWRESAERRQNEFAGRLAEELPDITPRFELSEGISHVEIIRSAREWRADLIAMPTHGWTGLRHLLLGSTTERVLREAPCPVLAVRPH